jgi:hypothetical protein
LAYYKHCKNPGLFKVDSEMHGIVSFSLSGDSTMKFMAKADFLKEYVRCVPDFSLKPATVTSSLLPRDMVLECYDTGHLVNGWSQPVFPKKSMAKLVKFSQSPENKVLPILYWVGERHIALVNDNYNRHAPHSEMNQRILIFSPSLVDIQGRNIEVWDVLAGGTFDLVTFDTPVVHPTHQPASTEGAPGVLSLDEFRKSKKVAVKDAQWYEENHPGGQSDTVLEYADGFCFLMQLEGGSYYLCLGNMEYQHTDLAPIEETLYHDWYMLEVAPCIGA